MGMEVKPSRGYPKANGKQIGMVGARSHDLDWCGQKRLGTQISSGSLRPVSPASRIPESPAVGISRSRFLTIADSHAFDLVMKKASKMPWHDHIRSLVKLLEALEEQAEQMTTDIKAVQQEISDWKKQNRTAKTQPDLSDRLRHPLEFKEARSQCRPDASFQALSPSRIG